MPMIDDGVVDVALDNNNVRRFWINNLPQQLQELHDLDQSLRHIHCVCFTHGWFITLSPRV